MPWSPEHISAIRDLHATLLSMANAMREMRKDSSGQKVKAYASYEEAILHRGYGMQPPANKRLPAGARRGKQRECFANAGNLSLNEGGRFVYCEGYALPDNPIFPIHHAWVFDTDTRRVVDTTWDEPGAAYFGIPFKRDYLLATILKTECWGILHYKNIEVFQTGIPPNALADVMDYSFLLADEDNGRGIAILTDCDEEYA